jgi:hypothetical protein
MHARAARVRAAGHQRLDAAHTLAGIPMGQPIGLAYRDWCVDARTFKPRPFRTERGALAAAQKWLCERKTEVDYARAIVSTDTHIELLRLAACGADTSEVLGGWRSGRAAGWVGMVHGDDMKTIEVLCRNVCGVALDVVRASIDPVCDPGCNCNACSFAGIIEVVSFRGKRVDSTMTRQERAIAEREDPWARLQWFRTLGGNLVSVTGGEVYAEAKLYQLAVPVAGVMRIP